MRISNLSRAGVCALGFVLLITPKVHAAAFANGSFESPVVTASQDRIDIAAGAFITGSNGWESLNTATNNSAIAIYSKVGGSTWAVPSDGNQISTLNSNGGTGKSGVQQVFDTITGQSYNLTFDYSSISDGTARTNVQATYEIDNGATAVTTTATPIASGTATVNTPASSLSFPAYQHLSLAFTAQSTTSTVRFTSLEVTGGNAFGPVVDNVQITPTPEPASIGLLGLAAMGVLIRRRRTAAE